MSHWTRHLPLAKSYFVESTRHYLIDSLTVVVKRYLRSQQQLNGHVMSAFAAPYDTGNVSLPSRMGDGGRCGIQDPLPVVFLPARFKYIPSSNTKVFDPRKLRSYITPHYPEPAHSHLIREMASPGDGRTSCPFACPGGGINHCKFRPRRAKDTYAF